MVRFSFVAVVGATLGVAGLIVACSSVPDFIISDDASASSSGGSSGAGSSGTTSSGASSGTTSSSGVPGCKPTGPENCFDGFDNDCNGKTDCDDPACTAGAACIDPAPAGWKLVAFSNVNPPGCTTGYDTPADLKVVGGTGTGTCTCDCAPTPTTGGTACDQDSFKIVVDNSACGTTGVTAAYKTACTKLQTNIDVPNGAGPTVDAKAMPPPGPTACTGTKTPAAGPLTTGRTCNLAAATPLGKGCAATTQVCAPKPSGFTVCVAKAGTNTCPAPYTKQWTAGTDGVDTRACNTCTCETKACSGTVSIFSANDCSTGSGKQTIGPLSGTCSAQSPKNWTAGYYKATLNAPTNGCQIAAGGFDNTMQGMITWTNQETVCCKP